MYLCCVTVEHLAKYLGMRIALEEEVKIENGELQPSEPTTHCYVDCRLTVFMKRMASLLSIDAICLTIDLLSSGDGEAPAEHQYTIFCATLGGFTTLPPSITLEQAHERFHKTNKPMEMYYAKYVQGDYPEDMTPEMEK